MITYTALIALAFFAGVIAATSRLRTPAAQRLPCYLDPAAGARARSAVSRLFEPDDQRLLSGSRTGGRLQARFRRQRRSAMRLFLRQTRQEFRSIMRDASQAAKYETAEYGAALTSLSLRFNRLYVGLWLRSQLACLLFRPIPQARLDEFVRLAGMIQPGSPQLGDNARA